MASNSKPGVKGFVRLPVEERFWSRVNKDGEGGCWLWTGATDHRYGAFHFEGRRQKAHRVAWLLTYGEVPPGKMACHTCDNPPCVNPAHIFWGTMSDNIQDAVRKGRHNPRGNGLRTHCKKGHPFSGSNLGSNRRGDRVCLACKEEHNNARGARLLTPEQRERKNAGQRARRQAAAARRALAEKGGGE